MGRGLNRDEVGALIFLRPDGCRKLAGLGEAAPLPELPHQELPADRLPKASATLSLGPLSEVLGDHIAQAAVTTFEWFNLETAVGRARVGCNSVRGQGATTRRARARKEE